MKSLAIIPTLSLLIAISVTANAGTQSDMPLRQEQKLEGAAKFTTGAIVGGLAGGPLGAVIGAIGGGLFAEQGFEKAASQHTLEQAQTDLLQLEEEIAMQEAKIAELEEDTLARLELKVFFGTGEDQVTELDRQRLRAMSDYLLKNPNLNVSLDGYADPRGSDEYNNVLSRERAATVKAILVDHGIGEDRVHLHYHGASRTLANGDASRYARDRRVDIELAPASDQVVTQANW